jgi:hypothetical protein
MNRRYGVFINDGDYTPHIWEVWEVHRYQWRGKPVVNHKFKVAEFAGKNCRAYALAHAKTLNLLPVKDQP